VYRSGHWVYNGTGLQDGDQFWYEPERRIEVDGALFTWEDGLPVVTGEDETPLSFIILGLQSSTKGHATMGIYTREGGGTVFNAATMGWGRGLWSQNNQDYTIVQQITRNVIDTLSSGEPPPPPIYPVEATSFTYEPVEPLQGEVMTFTAVITPPYATPPITYTWLFGDGTPVVQTTSSVISHTYDLAGSYTAVLTTTNSQGQATYSETISVASPPPPVYPVEATSFTYEPAEPLQGEAVTFTAMITPSYATPPITYTWLFGDGTPVVLTSSTTISHAYSTSNTYTVVLTTANAYGQSSHIHTVVVTSQSLPEPNRDHYIFLPIVTR